MDLREDIEVEMHGKCMRNLCGEDCKNVGHFLLNCSAYSEHCALF